MIIRCLIILGALSVAAGYAQNFSDPYVNNHLTIIRSSEMAPAQLYLILDKDTGAKCYALLGQTTQSGMAISCVSKGAK